MPIHVNSLGKSSIGIQVQTVERKMLPIEIKVPGSIEPIPTHQYDQHSPVSGLVSRVDVNLGQLVTQGQPLLVVESPEMNQLAATLLQDRLEIESNLATQKAALDEEVRRAQEQFNLADYNKQRVQKLYDERISSQKDLQQAQTDYALADSRLKTSTENRIIVLRTLKAKVEIVLNPLRQRLRMLGVKEADIKNMVLKQTTETNVPVLAARSGFITTINASPGKSIDPSISLFTISDQSKVWATAQIYEDDISRMKLGQHVEVKVQALHGEIVEGILTYIGTEVDPQTRTLAVRAELPNSDFRLKPDMYAELFIHTATATPVIAIPKEATVQQRGRDVVFIEQKDAYQPRTVKLGRAVGDSVEVISGLQIGDRVVTRGAFQLGAQMVKDSGGEDQFAAASEGEHLEDHESSDQNSSMNVSVQTMLLIVGIAFLLGFALCSVFLFRGKSVFEPDAATAKTGPSPKEDWNRHPGEEIVDAPASAPFVGAERVETPKKTSTGKGRDT